MRKLLILIAACLFGPIRPAFADVVGTGPAPVFVPASNPGVYFHVGPLNLTVPWDNVNVVYLYDFVGKQNLVGGEAVVATLWKFQGTAGAVTSIEGKGAPFIGGNMWFSNPIPSIAFLNEIKPGVFGGYNWNAKMAMWGVKAAFPVF